MCTHCCADRSLFEKYHVVNPVLRLFLLNLTLKGSRTEFRKCCAGQLEGVAAPYQVNAAKSVCFQGVTQVLRVWKHSMDVHNTVFAHSDRTRQCCLNAEWPADAQMCWRRSPALLAHF